MPDITQATTPDTGIVTVNRMNINGPHSAVDFDQVVEESPLQISLAWQNSQGTEQTAVFTITMRTPGDDKALALGLLLAEGQIADLSAVKSCISEEENELVIALNPGFQPDLADTLRHLPMHSSCGICGKTTLKSLALKSPPPLDKRSGWLAPALIGQLPQQLQNQQSLFAGTGGAHAAGLFDHQGQLLVVKEDVGRHNALDKVVGWQLQQGRRDDRQILTVSGRVSFELVQKAVMAGYPVLVAVGAPSSLAIAAARQFDLTLIGFTRPDRFNIYHGQWRLALPD